MYGMNGWCKPDGDLISRAAAIDEAYEISIDGQKFNVVQVETLMGLPPAQPNTDLQNLAEEIAAFKGSFKSANSDYLTGYLSALSLVEGMIAERRVEQDG